MSDEKKQKLKEHQKKKIKKQKSLNKQFYNNLSVHRAFIFYYKIKKYSYINKINKSLTREKYLTKHC